MEDSNRKLANWWYWPLGNVQQLRGPILKETTEGILIHTGRKVKICPMTKNVIFSSFINYTVKKTSNATFYPIWPTILTLFYTYCLALSYSPIFLIYLFLFLSFLVILSLTSLCPHPPHLVWSSSWKRQLPFGLRLILLAGTTARKLTANEINAACAKRNWQQINWFSTRWR